MAVADPFDEPPVVGPDDPPVDFSREEAAYARERDRLVRDHLGEYALVRKDEVIGAYATLDEAILDSFRRFGRVRIMIKEIRDPEEIDYYPHVDVTHPSIKMDEPIFRRPAS